MIYPNTIDVLNLEDDLVLRKEKMIIHVDELDRVIFDYDLIVTGDEIGRGGEGILKSVNSDVAKKIEEYFGIKIKEYGVEILDETMSYEDIA